MAISLIDVAYAYNSGALIATFSFAEAPVSGDLIVGVIRTGDISRVALPAGFKSIVIPHNATTSTGASGTGQSFNIVWKVATGSESNDYGMGPNDGGSFEKGGTLYLLRGADTVRPFGRLDVRSVANYTTPFSMTNGPLAVSAGSFVMATAQQQAGNHAISDTSTFSDGFIKEAYTWRHIPAYRLIPSDTYVQPTWTDTTEALTSNCSGLVVEICAEGSTAPRLVFADSFTDANGTLPENHNPDIGAGWIKHPSSEVDWVIQDNYLANSETAIYTADVGYDIGNDYSVMVDLRHSSSQSVTRNAICARMSPTANTMYYASFVAGATLQWQLIKRVAGSETILGYFSDALSTNNIRTLRLEVTDEHKKVFLGGTEIISSDDNEIETGLPGVWGAGMAFAPSRIDNFLVMSIGQNDGPPPDLQEVIQNFDLEWNIQQAALKNLDLKWNVNTIAEQSVELKYSINTDVLKNQNIVWDINSSALKSHELSWGILNSVEKYQQVSWSALERVSKEFEIDWKILARVYLESLIRWSIEGAIPLEPVLAEFGISWSVNESAKLEIDIAWDILRRVVAGKNVIWGINESATSNSELSWGVLGLVAASKDIVWGVNESAQTELDISWGINEGVKADSELFWDILSGVLKDTEIKWSVIQRTESEIALRWSIEGENPVPDLSGVIVINLASDGFNLSNSDGFNLSNVGTGFSLVRSD